MHPKFIRAYDILTRKAVLWSNSNHSKRTYYGIVACAETFVRDGAADLVESSPFWPAAQGILFHDVIGEPFRRLWREINETKGQITEA